MDFALRSTERERMDDAACDPTLLLKTVRQFESINRLVSRYRPILRRWVLADMATEPGRSRHLVDLGGGGCDIDHWLLLAAGRRSLDLRVTAMDSDPRIVAHARERVGGVTGLTVTCRDVLRDTIPDDVDYVFANHFLHHLDDRDIVTLIKRWLPHVRRRLIFSDLERSRLSYAGYGLLSLAYRGSFAREDGLLSIRRGFTAGELMDLATQAGVGRSSRLYRYFPGRLVLVIEGGGAIQVGGEKCGQDCQRRLAAMAR